MRSDRMGHRMAARLQRRHSDDVRARIQTSQLLNRLQANALGEIEMTREQIRSVEILLKKVLPDLQATTLDGELKLTGNLTVVSGVPRADD